jgi:hypothetical protein
MEKENSWPYRDSNSDPSVVQPVARLYTDRGIPDPDDLYYIDSNKIFLSVWNEECIFNI